jgi:opacity protein-like surface antigen
MKQKSIAILLLLSTLSIYVNAQTKQHNAVRIALRAGTYFSRFKFTGLPATYRKPDGDDAVYGGVQVDIPLSSKLSMAPEALYAISSVSSYINGPGLYSDDLSNILIPVLLKYKLGKISLFAGPQAEILLSANGAYINTTTNSIEQGDIKNDSYSKFGVSAVLGVEWVFKNHFGIDARYQQSLTDMRASNGTTLFTYQGSIKMHAFQTGLFFRFGKMHGKS